jgi:hypothetical protein
MFVVGLLAELLAESRARPRSHRNPALVVLDKLRIVDPRPTVRSDLAELR